MNVLILLGGAFCAVAFAGHIASIVTVVWRFRKRYEFVVAATRLYCIERFVANIIDLH